MNSEAILESRSLRMELCVEENGNILQKIDQLKKLPDAGWATSEQVGEFYEVPVKTVKKLVERHKDEFLLCGYKILYKS